MKRKKPASPPARKRRERAYGEPQRLSRKEIARRKRVPVGIDAILDTLKKTTPLGLNLEQAQIWEHWPEIVGEELSGHCRPETVRDGQLRISADSAVWMNRLNYQKWEIIRKVNRRAQKELIHDIFLLLLGEDLPPES